MSQPRKKTTNNATKTRQPARRVQAPLNVQSTAKARKPAYKLDIGAIVVGAIVIALIVLLVVKLVGPATVKNVNVRYLDSATKQKAAEENRSDEWFIRETQVMGKKISEIDIWGVEAREKLHLKGYELNQINKTSSSSVELVISSRIPLAVISTGSGYVVIDNEKNITAISNEKPDNLILIDGVTLRNPKTGDIANDSSQDSRLSNALRLAQLIYNCNYRQYLTVIHMLENRKVRLESIYGIPIELSFWLENTLEADLDGSVKTLVRHGTQGEKGLIRAANKNIYWHKDKNATFSAPTGM